MKKPPKRCTQLWDVVLNLADELSNQTLIICTTSAPAAIAKAKKFARKKWSCRIQLVSVRDAGNIDSF